MTYDACLDFLFSQLPIYQRIGKAAYKADLKNTIALCKHFNNPENTFRSIHIAGTNGKGSVSHMMASVLQESGLKVGLYTSPHLKDFRERIKINGEMISQDFVVQFVENNREAVQEIQPSFFEWTVVMAFEYFNIEKIDIAIIETGLGGRLDSTNVIKPELSIITNIALDHQSFLGNTTREIAGEKAGIIKEKIPVVIGEYTEESKIIFSKRAQLKNTSISFASDSSFPKYKMDLKGPYQLKNQNTVLQSLAILNESGFEISERSISEGLMKVIVNTGLRGRWDVLSEHPKVLADMAHNKAGIMIVLEGLKKEDYNELHIVWGMVSDKDAAEILELLPKEAHYYFCQPNIPRALQIGDLVNMAKYAGLSGHSCGSVNNALEMAKTRAKDNDLIYVGGSTFVVAEAV